MKQTYDIDDDCHNPIFGLFLIIYPKITKINERGWCRQKNQGENFGRFREPGRTSFLPRNEGKCRFKAKIFFYWINLCKN